MAPPAIKLSIGQILGSLTVVECLGRINGRILWRCRCSCGSTVELQAKAMTSGNTTSCGRCSMGTRSHGLRSRYPREYASWQAMLNRCYRKADPGYATYGEAGIVVADRWRDFGSFIADMGERPPNATIDRFPDGAGNYSPDNCRWATPHEQAVNRGTTRLTFDLVEEIHGRHEHGESNASIARRVGVSRCHISLILSGAKWKEHARTV